MLCCCRRCPWKAVGVSSLMHSWLLRPTEGVVSGSFLSRGVGRFGAVFLSSLLLSCDYGPRHSSVLQQYVPRNRIVIMGLGTLRYGTYCCELHLNLLRRLGLWRVHATAVAISRGIAGGM